MVNSRRSQNDTFWLFVQSPLFFFVFLLLKRHIFARLMICAEYQNVNYVSLICLIGNEMKYILIYYLTLTALTCYRYHNLICSWRLINFRLFFFLYLSLSFFKFFWICFLSIYLSFVMFCGLAVHFQISYRHAIVWLPNRQFHFISFHLKR